MLNAKVKWYYQEAEEQGEGLASILQCIQCKEYFAEKENVGHFM